MESARKIVNQFLKGKFEDKDLKSELYKAAEAAMEDGWTFMDTSFQIGGLARERGLADDEVEQILRRAFSSEKRKTEREEPKPEPSSVSAQATPTQAAMPPQTTIMPAFTTSVIPMEQMLAMGLDTQSLELLQNFKIDPEALSIPWPAADWRKDLAKLLEATFEEDETIDFKISDTPTATSELVSNIVGQDDSIKKIMKSLDSPEGALICINATKGGEDASDESWKYRYVMVDNPKMTLAKQLAYFKALNLPCAALINTGANSVQAWVKIGADSQEQYDERVDFLFKTLSSQGFQVDSSNRNPNMMVRMPGVLRGGKQQYLISLEQGAKNFTEWQQWVEYSLDGKPLIELASDSEEAPKKDEVLIQNMLQAGEFFLFTAPPKCGKSMALMDLGLSLCYGEEWFGNATSMSDVLFINFELTKSVFLNRLYLLANKRGLPASTANFGFLNLRGVALSPLETAQLIAKRVEGAKKMENHNYRTIVIDPISAVFHNPKAMRITGVPHQILMQMVDTIIALTGCAVVAACNNDEYPYLESRADSVLKLTPVEGGLNQFQINGSFREFPKLLARDCSWIYPRFLV